MLKATYAQIGSYLIVVCFFSISLLVFVNATISFVITNVLHLRENVGNYVGTLGFADELLALVACPLWGLFSDFAGAQVVCVIAYAIVGISLFLFVQVKNVFPQLLLARLLFSLGAAGLSTMITAILPAISTFKQDVTSLEDHNHSIPSQASASSMAPGPITQSEHRPKSNGKPIPRSTTTRSAGFVGLFSGSGALLALLVFLRLPNVFENAGKTPGKALAYSYDVVGTLAICLSVICVFGLRHLHGDRKRPLIPGQGGYNSSTPSLFWNLLEAVRLPLRVKSIGLAYVGGFVARSASLGITLFMPLFVNAYFISSGRCDESGSDPVDVKEKCKVAYTLAAELTGVSQLCALIFAPCFGYLAERYHRRNPGLLLAAIIGIIGYITLANLRTPQIQGDEGSPWILLVMALIGISQIGAIVCSLGLLGRCVQGLAMERGSSHSITSSFSTSSAIVRDEQNERSTEGNGEPEENAALLGRDHHSQNYEHLKGSIAGVYSFCGGLGILILTKLGGYLFDKSPSAPFYMLGAFNGILLLTGIACAILEGDVT